MKMFLRINNLNLFRRINLVKKYNFYLNNKFNFSQISQTNNFNKYQQKFVFIKENTKINDLTYKEEIFEFFAFNYGNLSNDEIRIIIDKLQKYQILESELHDLKCFLRDLLEIKHKLNDLNLINEIIILFNSKYLEIQNFKNNLIDNENYDSDFISLYYNFSNFVQENFFKFPNKDLKNVFTFYVLTQKSLPDKEFYNKIFFELVNCFKINNLGVVLKNNQGHLNFSDNLLILKYALEQFFTENFTDVNCIKYMLFNFIANIFEIYGVNFTNNKNQTFNIKDQLCNLDQKYFQNTEEELMNIIEIYKLINYNTQIDKKIEKEIKILNDFLKYILEKNKYLS